MRRRDFLKVVAGSTVTSPLAARAQQSALPAVGFLNTVSAVPFARMADGFRQGLQEVGYAEGQTVTIEYRWAEGHIDQLPALAMDLVNRHVAVIAATGGPAAGLAAKAATSTIPIVFVSGADPLKAGLIANFNRPGQYHRDKPAELRVGVEASRDSPYARSQSDGHWDTGKSELRRGSAGPRCAGGGGCDRATS